MRSVKHSTLLRFFALALSLCLLATGLSLNLGQTLAPEPIGEADTDYNYPDDWSRAALIFAVENSILQGDENRDLQPHSKITRAEMAAVLVRLLGATEAGDLSAYGDLDAAAWYWQELSCAVGAGLFNGVTPTQMQPNAPITREQAAVVLCRAFGLGHRETEAWALFSDGESISPYAKDSVSTLKALELLDGYTDGSFRPKNSITRAEAAQLFYNILDVIADTPEELPAEGWVLYRGTEPLPDTLTLEGALILGQGLSGSLCPRDWQISQLLSLRTGKNTQADLRGVETEQLVCAATEGSYTGSCKEVYLWGSTGHYTGDSEYLSVLGGRQAVDGNCDTMVLRRDSLELNGDLQTGAAWENTTLILNGRAEQLTLEGAGVLLSGNGSVGRLLCNHEEYTLGIPYDTLEEVWRQAYQAEHDSALQVVQTMRVPATMTATTSLYQNKGSGYLCTVEKGTPVFVEWNPRGSWVCISLEDGTQGWIARGTCIIHTDAETTDGDLDYSQAVKEGFVDLMGYTSGTEYLIWVSRYTQKVIVYQGSQGNWKVIETFPCSSGKNYTPTPTGIFSLQYRAGRWNFDNYYVKHAIVYAGDFAFHTILYNYDGTIQDGIVGEPRSAGCMRMLEQDAIYIYNLPIGTGVIIY